MKKLNICIDIDGTITGAYDWLDRANNFFNKNITPDDVKIYDMDKVMGVKTEEYQDFYIKEGKFIHKEAKLRENVRETLNNLIKNHYIHFVTARSMDMEDVTKEWLNQHNIPLDSLTLTGKHYKVDKAIELNCDIFIEDRYENAIELSKEGFKVLLIDSNYNRDDLNENIIRFFDWNEVESIIQKLY